MSPRLLAPLLTLLGAAALCCAAPAPVYREPPKPKVPPLQTAIQGTWEVDQNVFINGRARVLLNRRRTFIRIENNTWSYTFDRNGNAFQGARYQMRLDPRRSPAELDLLFQNNLPGAVNRITMKGIVKVEGDTLTFTYVHGDGQRPALFGAHAVPNGVWNGPAPPSQTMTLKRVP